MSKYTKAKIARLSEKVADDRFVPREGNFTITAGQGQYIVDNYPYEPQEKRTETGWLHIERHAKNITHNYWQDYSQIHFAKVKNDYYLVNGYHRIHGLIKAGTSATFNVVVKVCSDMEEIAEYYASFDSKTIVRHRTESQALKNVNLASRLGVTERIAKVAFKAIPIIKNKMRVIGAEDVESRVMLGIMPERIDDVIGWEGEINQWGNIVGLAKGEIKNLLIIPTVTAVALYTLRHASWADFWVRVAKDDGLREGMPEKALLTFLRKNAHGSSNDTIKAAVLAWNAACEGRKLKTLQVGNMTTLSIVNTPMSKN